MNKIIEDIKLRKFPVEGILGHIQVGNNEFKIIVWTREKNIRKIWRHETLILKDATFLLGILKNLRFVA